MEGLQALALELCQGPGHITSMLEQCLKRPLFRPKAQGPELLHLPPPGPHTLFHSFINIAMTIQPGFPGLLTGKGTQPWVLLSGQLAFRALRP